MHPGHLRVFRIRRIGIVDNQRKAFGRPGMGPCQGRMCGLNVAEVLARAHAMPVAEAGYFRLRWPIKPVPMDELSDFSEPEIEAGDDS